MATGQKLGARKRFKGWSKKRISEHMAGLAKGKNKNLTVAERKAIGTRLLESRGQVRRTKKLS